MSQPPTSTTEQPAAGDARGGLQTALDALTVFEGKVAAQILYGQGQALVALISLSANRAEAIDKINSARDEAIKTINNSGRPSTADSDSLTRLMKLNGC